MFVGARAHVDSDESTWLSSALWGRIRLGPLTLDSLQVANSLYIGAQLQYLSISCLDVLICWMLKLSKHDSVMKWI